MLKEFFHKNYFLSNLYLNFHKVDEDLYRSAQPTKNQFKNIIKKHNIKTILNLRGKEHLKDLNYEIEIAKKYNVKLISVSLKSRGFAKEEELLNLINILKSIKTPGLIHCKAGSDRTGFVAVLYLHVVKNIPIKKALKELNFFPYLHIKYSQAGKMDFFFEKYLEFSKNNNLSLMEWIEKYYDKDEINKEFKQKSHFLDFLNDKILKRE